MHNCVAWSSGGGPNVGSVEQGTQWASTYTVSRLADTQWADWHRKSGSTQWASTYTVGRLYPVRNALHTRSQEEYAGKQVITQNSYL